MKATVKKIVDIYRMLGDAKAIGLEDSEKIKIIKARKAMRPIAEEYEALLRDAQDKLKPENWDSIQEKVAKWQNEGANTTLTAEEKTEINQELIKYESAIRGAVKDDAEKEVTLSIESLKEESYAKLMSANGWEFSKVEELAEIL